MPSSSWRIVIQSPAQGRGILFNGNELRSAHLLPSTGKPGTHPATAVSLSFMSEIVRTSTVDKFRFAKFIWYAVDAMKLSVEELLRSRVRDREKIARAIHAIDRLRRKAPAGWKSVEILRRLRETR